MDKKRLLDSLRNENFSSDIVKAFESVEREKFVEDVYKNKAYENIPLPIGYEQTISQPYTIAFMLDLLDVKNNEKILEIGSGCGYVLRLIREIAPESELYGIERIRELYEKSKGLLKDYDIKLIHGDGGSGLREKAPFDRILVSAAANDIPDDLIKQLKVGGKLVIPIKNKIVCLEKGLRKNFVEEFYGFVFVPLI